jgi:putative salt-induced outer membrane protein
MNLITKLGTAVSVAALLTATPILAQQAVVGIEDLDDRIEDIERDIDEEMAEGEDSERFGSNQYAQGLAGSLSLGLSATEGNTDTADLAVAGRLRYGSGPWNHTFGFAFEAAEDNNVRNKEEAFVTYDVNRYVSENAYIFGLGSVRYDGFATNKWDAFLGAGPGYRVINKETTAWRVQAGPGVRYIEDQAGNDETEVAGIASSRLYQKISDSAFLSNDTDVLFSDDNTLVVNDLGVTFKMTESLATRTSLRTEWNSDPLPGRDDTDTSLNVSLVVGF